MIYLYGAGGHAKVIIEILQAQGVSDIAAIDENKEGMVLGIPITYKSVPENLNTEDQLIVAIGQNHVRKLIAEKDMNLSYAKAVHPSCNISPSAMIGAGTVAMAGAVVNAEAVVGNMSY